jgi:hypothetical protein
MCPSFVLCSPVCMCSLYVYQGESLTSFQGKGCWDTACRSICAIFASQRSVSTASDIYFSRLSTKFPTVVLSLVIWSLVFTFIISRVYLTFAKAVVLILKHATFLRLSNSSRSALARADMDYRRSNIDVTIYQFLMPSPEPSSRQCTHFLMATEIGLFIFASLTITSHQAFLVPPQSSVETGTYY